MKIEHVAVWTTDLERLRGFYERFFGARAGPKYVNPAKSFQSYFLSFDSGARLEIMHNPNVAERATASHAIGIAHLAFAAGSSAAVDELTDTLRNAGITVVDGPRWTGDGYYESVILDPDGNRIEVTS